MKLTYTRQLELLLPNKELHRKALKNQASFQKCLFAYFWILLCSLMLLVGVASLLESLKLNLSDCMLWVFIPVVILDFAFFLAAGLKVSITRWKLLRLQLAELKLSPTENAKQIELNEYYKKFYNKWNICYILILVLLVQDIVLGFSLQKVMESGVFILAGLLFVFAFLAALVAFFIDYFRFVKTFTAIADAIPKADDINLPAEG